MDALSALLDRLPQGSVSTHPGELTARSRDAWALAMLREARGERMPRPMAVAFPGSTEEVATVLRWAAETGTPVVPRGAGSGVVGGAQAVWRGIVLDLSRLSRVLEVDEVSQTVRVEAGARGDRVEAALEPHGLTLGHYPQSIAISSVGGWIAARSAGQASAGYGAIEDLLLGLTAVLAGGHVLTLRPAPRTAAGPDLRAVLTGSEGTLGVVTEAVLSASRRPEAVRWLALRPSSFTEGCEGVREVVQRDLHPLVVRLYDETDAGLSFGALGHQSGAVLVVGLADGPGAEELADVARRSVGRAKRLSDDYGRHWWEHRNDAVDLYRRIMGEERMFGAGVIVDTLEVAGVWRDLPGLYASVRGALGEHASHAVGCHLSHPYRSGASLYFTFLIHADDDATAERRYLACWADAARACHEAGGTVSHHHGIGILKAPFLEGELGPEGVAVLRRIKEALDPRAILNPGKLLPAG